MSGTCQAERYKGRCCCTCQWHIEDFHHCTTAMERRAVEEKCVCSDHKGWICMPPELGGRAHSGWSGHGMCECHEFKPATTELRGMSAARREAPLE